MSFRAPDGDSVPATLGFNAVAPEWLWVGAAQPPRPSRPLSRRSGRIPALPYPPLRCIQSGTIQLRRAMIFQRTAHTPLTSCLTPGVHFRASPVSSCHEGQFQLVLLPLVAHESRRLLAAPINPLRGPFGPSALACLLRPLLTSAARSGRIASPSVLNPGQTADLPR